MAECEGFICPLCMRNFRDVPQLERHFQEEHSETAQSRFRSNVTSNIKNIFGKLKKKGSDGSGVADGAAAVSGWEEGGMAVGVVTNVSGIDHEYWEPQAFGYSRDLVIPFRKVRDARASQTAAEMNRLIIRMEKLYRALSEGVPRTTKGMKELEKSVVTWRLDKEEIRCKFCGRSFNLGRRKHHCRLCGDIICKRCSSFMGLGEAYPALSDSPDFHSLAPPLRTRVLKLPKRRRRRKEEEEEEEEEEEGKDELRMCGKCCKLINRKLQQLQAMEKPLLTALYEKMQMVISEADSKKPAFLDMAESLLAGEHGYRLHEASVKRQQLFKLYEVIDAISKDILSLAQADAADPSAPSQRNFKLCRGVRVYASNYLQDNLLTLPSIPTAHKLAEIREKKDKEARERVRELERQREIRRREEQRVSRGPAHAMLGTPEVEERETEEEDGEMGRGLTVGVPALAGINAGLNDMKGEAKRRFDKLKTLSSKVTSRVNFKKDNGGGQGGAVTLERLHSGSGWMGDSLVPGSVDSHEDPFALQREQLSRFIQQAKLAGREDEVATLQKSLQEIEGVMEEQRMQNLMGYSYQ